MEINIGTDHITNSCLLANGFETGLQKPAHCFTPLMMKFTLEQTTLLVVAYCLVAHGAKTDLKKPAKSQDWSIVSWETHVKHLSSSDRLGTAWPPWVTKRWPRRLCWLPAKSDSHAEWTGSNVCNLHWPSTWVGRHIDLPFQRLVS